MPIRIELFQSNELPQFIFVKDDTALEEVLGNFRSRQGEWTWLLVRQNDTGFQVCSFGSLLPYLLGRTPHIIHNLGDCAICSQMNPLLWQDTNKLLDEALANNTICTRSASDLPMAELRTAEMSSMGTNAFLEWVVSEGKPRVAGITDKGELKAVYVVRMRAPGGLPSF